MVRLEWIKIAKVDRGFENLKRAFKTAVNDDSRVTVARPKGDARRTRQMTTLTAKQVKKLIEVLEDTPTEQIQAIYSSGLLADLRDGNIGQVNREEFRRVLGLKPLNPPLLERLGSVIIPATTSSMFGIERFKMKEHGGVCSYLGDNFRSWFLSKIEDQKTETTLRYATLTHNSLDRPILDELGELAETTLTEMLALMRAQADGKRGHLLVDAYANIFYVKDSAGILRSLRVRWYDDGWRVDAYDIRSMDAWPDGSRVFYRMSPRTPTSTKKEEDRNLPRRGEIRTFLP